MIKGGNTYVLLTMYRFQASAGETDRSIVARDV